LWPTESFKRSLWDSPTSNTKRPHTHFFPFRRFNFLLISIKSRFNKPAFTLYQNQYLMKKTAFLFTLMIISVASLAQTPYRTSLGLGIDVGNGSSFFGPQIKHVFGTNAALQAQIMFSDYNFMYIGGD